MTHQHTIPSRLRATLVGLACLALPMVAACQGKAARADSESTFCAQLEDTAGLADTFGEPTTDFADVAASFKKLADLAPDEISADVHVVVDAIVNLAESPEHDPEAVSAALDVVLSPDVTSATERIGAYAVDTCGIEPSAWTM